MRKVQGFASNQAKGFVYSAQYDVAVASQVRSRPSHLGVLQDTLNPPAAKFCSSSVDGYKLKAKIQRLQNPTQKLKICVSKFTSVYASTKETTKSFPVNSSGYPLPSLTGAGLPSIVLMIDLFMHVVDILAGQLSLPDCYHRLIELIGG